MAGEVRVNGELILQPSRMVVEGSHIEIAVKSRYVSRGGEKLEPALKAFGFEKLDHIVSVDVGSSTGGFTDCMLQHGAAKVYAIDVGYGILDWSLRKDERVIVMERTNARYVKTLPEAVDLVTIDASFISLKVLLPVIKDWFDEQQGTVIALIKPQFEASREEAAREIGVIRDEQVHESVLNDVLGSVVELGYSVNGLIRSPVKGPKGNVEFLGLFKFPAQKAEFDVSAMISALFP